MKNTTKLCESKPIVTVNGRFPGPTIVAREDDTVMVKVVNHVKYNLSVHWLVALFLNYICIFKLMHVQVVSISHLLYMLKSTIFSQMLF